MNRRNRFNHLSILLPRSLSLRILFTLLLLSLVPMVSFGAFSMQFVEKTISDTAEQTGTIISSKVIRLYQSNLESQADLINMELKNIEQHVITTQRLSEQIFSEAQSFPVTHPLTLTKEELDYYWEKNVLPNESNTGTNSYVHLTRSLHERLERSEYLEPIFRQSLKSNPNIVSMYFIFPESAWRIYPAIDLNKEVEKQFFDPLIPITSYPFYTQALPKNNPDGQPVWSNPYQDITHRSWLLTASAPVLSPKHELLGVAAADITIDNIVQNILDTKFTHLHSFAFLVNQSGEVIAIQEKGKPSMQALPLSTIIKPAIKEGAQVLDLPNNRLMLTAPIPIAGWYLGYVIPKEEMISPIYEQANKHILASGKSIVSHLTLASIALLLLCMGMTFFMWRGITAPMEKLLEGIKDVGAGNFNHRIPNSGILEFDQLSISFNLMSKEVNHLVQALDQRISEKEILQTKLLHLNNNLETTISERTEELKKANQTLMLTNQQLKELEASRSTLFSNISHDLKTPLTIITGYMEAIRDGMIPTDQQDFYLEKIQHRITSVNRLVHDLFELSLFETKSKTLERQKVRLDQFIEAIRNRWYTLMKTDPQPIVFSVTLELKDKSTPTSYIDVDLHHLDRAIDNLIENAKKYGASDKPIALKISASEDHLFLSVSDEGLGIPEEHLPFLFDRSYRVDRARNTKIPGNGLGLTIVKEIIEAHHGEVTVQSKLNEGTTFSLKLPLCGTNR